MLLSLQDAHTATADWICSEITFYKEVVVTGRVTRPLLVLHVGSA